MGIFAEPAQRGNWRAALAVVLPKAPGSVEPIFCEEPSIVEYKNNVQNAFAESSITVGSVETRNPTVDEE